MEDSERPLDLNLRARTALASALDALNVQERLLGGRYDGIMQGIQDEVDAAACKRKEAARERVVDAARGVLDAYLDRFCVVAYDRLFGPLDPEIEALQKALRELDGARPPAPAPTLEFERSVAAYEHGRQDARNGVPDTHKPYWNDPTLRQAWCEGYHGAKAAIAAGGKIPKR